MSDRLTLADVLGRSVPVEWHESVALIRGVVERVLERPSHAAAVPELHEIEISPDGAIEVTGTTTAGEPVRRLGQLLQAMLGHSAPPVQLRLLITQATAPTPSFGSIREYDEALAYFERPGRNVVLQALHARAAAAPRISETAPTPTLDTVAPLPATELQKSSHRRFSAKSTPRGLKLAATGVVLLLVCGTGAWYAGVATITRGGLDASTVALKASSALGDAVVTGLSAVTEAAGLGRIMPAGQGSVETVVPIALEAKPSRIVRRPATSEAPGVPNVAFDLDFVRDTSAHALAVLDEKSALLSDLPIEAAENNRELIFSSNSEGVTPPVAVRQQLPRELSSNVGRERLSRIDLIIAADGTVDSVRLVGAPRSVNDSMLLSAAKAWEFQPALKDGVPVRYYKSIWLASR